jgi:hypothetical protein
MNSHVVAVLADARDRERTQGRVLRLQGDDRAPDPQRQHTLIRRRRVVRREETAHAARGEAGRLVPEGPLGNTGLARWRERRPSPGWCFA